MLEKEIVLELVLAFLLQQYHAPHQHIYDLLGAAVLGVIQGALMTPVMLKLEAEQAG